MPALRAAQPAAGDSVIWLPTFGPHTGVVSASSIGPLIHILGIAAVMVALRRAERRGVEAGDWEPLSRFVGPGRWLMWLVLFNATIMLINRVLRQADPVSQVLAAVVVVALIWLIWKVKRLRKQHANDLATLLKRPS